MNTVLRRAAGTIAGFGAALFIASAAQADGEVNIYSYRQPDLIAPLLEAFTKETGIETNVLFFNQGLDERLKAEGENSPADIIMTVDIGRLEGLKTAGVTQPLEDATIEANIPAQYRDPEGHWFGLAMRARVVYASRERVKQDTITYEELADPKWKGKVCLRSGQHAYNIALIASMIAHHGAEKAEEWLTGLRDNLARKPDGNDRSQAKSIYAGECDIALGNTYYVGLMMTDEKEPEQKEWAKAIKVLFPNSGDRGTHVNLSGMALAKYAPHKENAVKLMEFLSSGKAQEIYANQVFEYPLKDGTRANDIVLSFGDLKPDTLSLDTVAGLRKQASELVDKVGFDNGPSM